MTAVLVIVSSMPQRLSSKYPQTKSSSGRQSKPTAKRQKVQNDGSPTIQTPAKMGSSKPVQIYGEEEELCLKRFDLTSKFGELLSFARKPYEGAN